MDSDTAASDLIATVALIAVFVTGAAIVGVALLSHPPGDAAPAMIARNVTDGGKFYIYHEGGDPLEREYFEILVDGARQTGNITLINASGYESKDWVTWKTGEALNLSDVTRDLPENTRIQIVGEGVGRIGSDWLLHEIGGGMPATPTEDPPVADFTADPTGGNAPLTVQFSDISTGEPTSWHWEFGDGNTSTVQHPIHTYESPGTYTVSLTATNAGGSNTETKTAYITVTLPPPLANFTANTTAGPALLAVQFNDTSTGNPNKWLWNFGDGNTSAEQNPIHTYVSPGNYTVTLNASNDYGFSIETKSGYITVLEPPTADFNATPSEGNAPLTVRFTDQSAGDVTAWVWNFGDGNTSTEQNPIHIYESPGTYTVSLNASNDYGFSIETKTRYITVLESPVAAFTADPTEGNAPLTVQFTDESAGNVTVWLWDFGDGNTSTDQNPSHTYENPGTYTVNLTVSNTYSEDTETRTDYITVLEPPEADFSATPTEGNAPLIVQFTDKSAGNVTAWVWDFGDGNRSTEQNPNHTYTAPGTYTVSLTVSNAYSEDTETRTDYITVLEPPEADFSATPTEGNAPLIVQFTDESAGNVTAWAWDFGDGSTSTDQNPSHTYENPGTYTVSLTVSNAYSEDTKTRTDYITVLEPPVAAFTANPTEGNAPLVVQFTDESAGNVTAWLWDFGDGNTSTDQHPSHTYVSAGTYSVTLNASNAYGYSISAPTTITVLEPPVAAFTATPTEGNAPLAVQFTDESTGNVTAWAWDFGDGNTSADQHPSHTYVSAGIYTISLNASNDYGFSIKTKTEYITVLEPPVAAFTATPTEGNAPLVVQFTDESAGNVTAWAWDFGDGNTSTEQNPSHTYENPGNYTVSLTVSNAYSEDTKTRTDYITVLEPPVAAFTADPTEGNAPLTVQFTDESAGNVTAWAWDFGDGNTSTEQDPIHTYESPGTYTVSLTVSNAYSEDTETRTNYITVLEPPVADFTATPTEGNAPLAVQFTDESAGDVTAWHWDFGDGNTSADQNPGHTYVTPGIYTVNLTVSNAYSEDTETRTNYITVLEPPAADFSATPTEGNAPLTVQFTDESAGNVTAWAWDFGDGNTSFEQNPNHIYEGPGTYTVVLNASNAYGYSISAPTTITVLEPPAADFTADPTEGNAPLSVQFTDESTGNVTAWAWDFGDGNTSTDQNPSHTYEGPGTYTVVLNASNTYGFSIKAKTEYITVLEPLAANFTANVTEGNAPLAVQFNDTSTGNPSDWLWDFGDGNTSTDQNPIHTYESTGNYTVSLTATNDYGNNTHTRLDYIWVTEKSFIDNVIDENVFVYGTILSITGGVTVMGEGATVVITEGLNLGGNGGIAVSNIYANDSVTLSGGSAGLGSLEEPGKICVNGDLTLQNGVRNISGDVYVNGNFYLNGAKIYGDVYVNGDLTLSWGAPEIVGDARIYYTGAFEHPPTMSQTVIGKCIHQTTVPRCTMLDLGIPSTKPEEWYEERNYADESETLKNDLKIFASSYTSTSGNSASNVTIIAYDGDISITGGWSTVTGIFYAPRGKVTFDGYALEGVVIARDGFYVINGGSVITFKNIDHYITDPADYPF
ncbi:MAG: PKD domain-containing protein [Methanoculleus sp.]